MGYVSVCQHQKITTREKVTLLKKVEIREQKKSVVKNRFENQSVKDG